MKRCAICKQDKVLDDFHKCGKYRASYCKPCQKTFIANWKLTHPTKRNKVNVLCQTCGKELFKETYTLKKWKGDCQPCAAVKVCKSFTGTTRSEQHRRRTGLASRGRKKSERALEILRQRTGALNHNWDPDREAVAKNDRARKEMYSLIHSTLKRFGRKKETHSVDLLGYSALDLYDHLTRNLKAGMSWERRGEWHIDHIKPVSRFVAEGITDPKIINALSNLQPLWKHDNLSKCDRVAA